MLNTIRANATYDFVDEELVYQWARFFGEAGDKYKDKQENLWQFTFDRIDEYLDTTMLPIHAGTIKYLKEKGAWKPEHEARNQELLSLMDEYEEAWIAAIAEAGDKEIRQLLSNPEWLELWQSYREKLEHFKPLIK